MPTITYTVSAAAATEIVDALCGVFHYRDTILVAGNPQPNPETRAQFARRMQVQWLKERVLEYRRAVALATANPADPEIS